MKKSALDHFFIHISFLGFALAPAVGSALDLQTRLQVGVIDYEYDDEGHTQTDGSSYSGYKLGSTLPFVGGGVTAFQDKFFFDIYLQKAFSGSDEATETYIDIDSQGSYEGSESINADFDREESSFSVGYALGDQSAVFAGYRKARTNFDQTFEKVRINYTETGTRDTNFTQSGYFVGGAYAFSVSERGTVTLNAALALLDGKYGYHENSVIELNSGTSNDDEYAPVFKGDTAGLNLGVAWKGRMFEQVDYTLGLDGYSYDFEFDSIVNEGEKVEAPKISESVMRLSGGLTYRF